ncbi:ABC transporter permease [Chloroflexota bacterium]
MKVRRKNKINFQIISGLTIVITFVVIALAAPWLAEPLESDAPPSMFKVVGRRYDPIPKPPNEEAILGTLTGQIDVYYSLIWGTRHALRFGLSVALSTGIIGTLIGAISGYAGGRLNQLLLRFTDGFLAIPVIIGVGIFRQMVFLAEPSLEMSVIQRIVGVIGSDYVLLGLIFFSWMPYTRIINANMMKLRQFDYVMAAKSIGASNARIIFLHMLPNSISPAIVLIARDIGSMVLWGATFVFIGIGGESPWGELASLGRNFVVGSFGNPFDMWWTYIPVTIVLILFGIGWNLLGDGLNDLINPRENYW